MKVYVIGGALSYANIVDEPNIVNNPEDADVAILTGGEDVNPELYNEIAHYTTSFNTSRDAYEISEVNKCLKLGLPIIGVCRGSQLTTVINEGKLIQNVAGQPYIHKVVDVHLNKAYEVTSTHHQMMFPFNLNRTKYKVLAFAKNLTHTFEGLPKGFNKPEIEPEIVYYPETNMLAIQSHPEHLDVGSELRNVSNYYVSALIKNELKNKYTIAN
jgi:anthranilate/para-aminobenzoate synthase component II